MFNDKGLDVFTLLLSFIHVVVDVAAQSCNTTAVNPASLTSDRGVLNNGTLNVTIECRCVDNKNRPIKNIKWFFQNGSQVLNISSVPTGAPYLMTNKKIAMLIIPVFNDTYKGNYTCGKGQKLQILSPNTAIQLLLLPGKTF